MNQALLAICFVSVAACGGSTIVRDTYEIGGYTPSQLNQENGGVRATFKVIGPGEPELAAQVQACDPRTGAPAVYADAQGPTLADNGKPIMETISLAPKGTWWVKVSLENSTDHVIRLDHAVVKLIDPASNTHELLSKDDVVALLRASRSCRTTATAADQLQVVKFFQRQTEILPGSSYSAWLAFNPRQTSLIPGTWKTSLYEVPIETDQAGAVTKTTRFELPTRIIKYRETYKSGGMFGSDKLISRDEVN